MRRPATARLGRPVTDNTSADIAIAEQELFVAAGGLGYAAAPGWLVAYAAP